MASELSSFEAVPRVEFTVTRTFIHAPHGHEQRDDPAARARSCPPKSLVPAFQAAQYNHRQEPSPCRHAAGVDTRGRSPSPGCFMLQPPTQTADAWAARLAPPAMDPTAMIGPSTDPTQELEQKQGGAKPEDPLSPVEQARLREPSPEQAKKKRGKLLSWGDDPRHADSDGLLIRGVWEPKEDSGGQGSRRSHWRSQAPLHTPQQAPWEPPPPPQQPQAWEHQQLYRSTSTATYPPQYQHPQSSPAPPRAWQYPQSAPRGRHPEFMWGEQHSYGPHGNQHSGPHAGPHPSASHFGPSGPPTPGPSPWGPAGPPTLCPPKSAEWDELPRWSRRPGWAPAPARREEAPLRDGRDGVDSRQRRREGEWEVLSQYAEEPRQYTSQSRGRAERRQQEKEQPKDLSPPSAPALQSSEEDYARWARMNDESDDERAERPHQQLRQPRCSETSLRQMQQAEAGRWQTVQQCGWKGPQIGARREELLPRLLAESGLSFVKDEYMYYLRVPESGLTKLLKRVQELADELDEAHRRQAVCADAAQRKRFKSERPRLNTNFTLLYT